MQRALKALPENDDVIREYFMRELDYRALEPFAQVEEKPKDAVKMCEELASLLISLDAATLTQDQKRALNRTQAVLNEVLGQ